MESRFTTVLVFGTYDKLHPGHEFFLQTAASYGDRLVVVVARDQNVAKLKGHAPRDWEQQRLANIQALPYVSEAQLGLEDFSKREQVIYDVRPDIICLGYDQAPGFKSPLPEIKVIRLPAFHPEKYKSSLL